MRRSDGDRHYAGMRAALTALAIALVATVAVAGIASARPRSATTITVRVAPEWRVPSALWIPMLVARARGYYRSAGIDVEIVLPSESASTTALLAAGAADLGFASTPELVYARRARRPVVAIANLTVHNNWAIFARSGTLIDLSALKGARIAVDSGVWTNVMLPYLLESAGLHERDVIRVSEPAGVVRPLLRKQVDLAADMTNFGVAEEQYRAGRPPTVVLGTSAGAPDVPAWAYLGSTSWLQRQPREAKAWLAATRAGARYARANPARAVAILERAYPQTRHAHRFNLLSWKATMPLLGAARESDEQWSQLTDAMVKTQQLDVALPAESYFTNRYLPSVR